MPQALLALLETGRSRAEGCALLLQLLGRLLTLAATERAVVKGSLAARASAWLTAVGWARRGWAWLCEVLRVHAWRPWRRHKLK